MQQLPSEIYQQLAVRSDYKAERRAATAIFRALNLGTAKRKLLTNYCIKQDIIPSFTGYEPEVAIFCLKVVMREVRNNGAALRVSEYVLMHGDPDWYPVGVYPEWTGNVTAMINPDVADHITYAVHVEDLVRVPTPFSAKYYTGTTKGQVIYEIQQSLSDYVGELSEDAQEVLDRVLQIYE